MHDISRQRCFNHAQREAAALCTHCRRSFCRECVTEHDDRLICATCLKTIAASGRPQRHSMQLLALSCRCLAAGAVLWIVFYALGQLLLRLPTSFHEGALWSDTPY